MPPRLREFGPVEQNLADVVDRLGDVIAAVVAAAGATPPKIPRVMRPRTADDRLASRRVHERHEHTVHLFAPHTRT